jgi:hypothetical protein
MVIHVIIVLSVLMVYHLNLAGGEIYVFIIRADIVKDVGVIEILVLRQGLNERRCVLFLVTSVGEIFDE